jgi:hypothetical protein
MNFFKRIFPLSRKRQRVTPEMEANRADISANDCDEAVKYLSAFLDLKEKDDDSGTSEFFTHREGLLVAAIVAYSRPFIGSFGGEQIAPKLKVNLGKVFNHDRSNIDLHNRILEIRHKAVAHSDWKYRQSTLMEAIYEQGVPSVRRRASVVTYSQGIDVQLFVRIAEIMRGHFRREMFDRDLTQARPQ